MIQPNEVRLGNLIKSPKGDRVKVTGFFENLIYYNKGEKEDLQHFEPIPLTAEILLQSGFEKTVAVNSLVLYRINKLVAEIFDDGRVNFSTIGSEFYEHICFCRYTHQLQNLFFVITGRELEIKM
jgi:hypothetical protein